MGKPLKIAIISHALVIPAFQNRWKSLAQDKKYEVNLLIPRYWVQTWFGEKIIYHSQEVHEGNFHVYPLPTTNDHNWGTYLFKSFDAKFRQIKPDLIYVIHEESIRIHHQIYIYKRIFAPQAKVVFFSMNALGVPYQRAKKPIKRWIKKRMWNSIKRNTAAALVHYPGCLHSLRSGNYDKPIYLQTQVGVDERLFSSDRTAREKQREKIGFAGKFVIGYTGRLTSDKGVDDLVDVFISLFEKNEKIALLLVGNGDLKADIEKRIADLKLGDRVHITGFVDQVEVPNYMNAMDAFVLASKTTPNWLDTFPLVTVQAQSVGVPVIASNSASIPWQLADSAKIFQERDKDALQKALIEFIENGKIRHEYAQKGQKRSREYFCHAAMNENFKKIARQIMSNQYVYHRKGEPYTQWKAY